MLQHTIAWVQAGQCSFKIDSIKKFLLCRYVLVVIPSIHSLASPSQHHVNGYGIKIDYIYIPQPRHYRPLSISGHPLRFQAKNSFLCSFYVVIWWPKMKYLNCSLSLQCRGVFLLSQGSWLAPWSPNFVRMPNTKPFCLKNDPQHDPPSWSCLVY